MSDDKTASELREYCLAIQDDASKSATWVYRFCFAHDAADARTQFEVRRDGYLGYAGWRLQRIEPAGEELPYGVEHKQAL